MSFWDTLTDEKLRLWASAMRAWSGDLDRRGLHPEDMVSEDVMAACCELMDRCPEPPGPEEGESEPHA